MSERRMTCENCGGVWRVPGGMPGKRIECPYCELAVCACGCGADISELRADARFVLRGHADALRRAEGGETEAAKSRIARAHPLEEVRAEQEAAQRVWSDRIYWAIVERLIDGEFHADDLAPLRIPAERRNIIGAQVGGIVRQGFAIEVGRRKSSTAQGHGRKSGVFKLTEKGRAKFAGLSTGVPSPQGTGGNSPPVGASAEPSERTLTLVPDSVGPEAPKSAIKDAEAA